MLLLLLLGNDSIEDLVDVVVVHVALRVGLGGFGQLRHCFGSRIDQTAPVHLLHVRQRNLPSSGSTSIRQAILQNPSGSGRRHHHLLLSAWRHLQVILVDVQLVVR